MSLLGNNHLSRVALLFGEVTGRAPTADELQALEYTASGHTDQNIRDVIASEFRGKRNPDDRPIWGGGPSYNVVASRHVGAKNWLDQFMQANGGRYPTEGEFRSADAAYHWNFFPATASYNPNFLEETSNMSLLGNIGKLAMGVGKFIPGVNTVINGIETVPSVLRPAPATFPVAPGRPAITQAGVVPAGLIGKVGGMIGKVAGRSGPLVKQGAKAAGGIAGTAMVWNGVEWVMENAWGGDGRKRRTMNPFNPKALKRADRRVKAFSDRARPVLRELGYTVSSHRHVKPTKKKRR